MALSNISDAFADLLLEAWLTRDLTDLPTSYFVGLTLALPTDQNGLGLLEPTNDEFERIEVVAESASWLSMGVGSRSSTLNFDLLYSMAITDWGQILGYTIYDSLTDGLFLGYGITNPLTILSGMRAQLPAGSIVITLPF